MGGTLARGGQGRGRLAAVPGTRGVRPGDADRFFGRDALVADLVERVRAHRVVGLFGPSGSGKSSLLHAGLLPALPELRVLSTTPATWPQDGPGEVDLVVVDQFEELFTHLDNPGEFVEELLRHRVVLAARADFLGHCAALPGLVEALREATVLVGPMSDDELADAIERPAAAAGLKVQPEMLATAVADVRGQPGALPLLSHALLETWRRRERGRLTLDGYRASGGVVGAVAATAEHTYAQLTPEGQTIARGVLLRLVHPGGAGDLRRRAPLPEVLADRTAHVVDLLAAARLIVVADGMVELTHEAVTRAWPRLREWIDSDQDSLRLHRDFTAAAQVWDSTEREPCGLYRGLRLAAVRDLAERPEWDVSSTELEREFLRAGLDQERAEQQEATRHTRRLRSLVKALAAVTVTCLAVASVAVVQRHSAVRQQRVAESRQLAVQAQDLSNAWPDAAAELAVSAYRTSPTAEARGALLSTAAYKPVRTVLKDHRGPVRAVAFNGDGTLLATGGDDRAVLVRRNDSEPVALSGHDGAVRAVAFQPGGPLASAEDDRKIVLWDLDRRVPVRTLPLDHGRVRALAFTSDGAVMASASADGPVVLWRTRDWTEIGRVPHDLGEANGVAFSADGTVLAVAGTRGVLVRDGGGTRTFTDHDAAVRTVALTADGRTLASGGDDHQVVLRDLAGGTAEHLRRHVSPVWTVQFSVDGTKVLSASDDGGIRWWAVPGGGWLTGLITRSNAFYAAALNPDGTRLAAGGDEHVSVWRQPLPPFTGHVNPPHAVAVSAEGAVATGGPDRMILLWDAAGRQTGRIETPEAVTGLAFRPDGLLVSAFATGVVTLWKAGRPMRTWRGEGEITSLAVSPSGASAVTGGAALTVWHLDAEGPGRVLSGGHSGPVHAVAFQDEGVLAAGGADGTVLLWDVASGRSISVLRQDGPPVKSLAFARNALVVGDAGGEVAVWEDGRKARSFTVRGAIRSVAVSGDTIASADADSLITLWNLADGARVATLTGHTGPVNAVAFAPSNVLLSSGPDPRVVRWELDPEQVIAEVRPGT